MGLHRNLQRRLGKERIREETSPERPDRAAPRRIPSRNGEPAPLTPISPPRSSKPERGNPTSTSTLISMFQNVKGFLRFERKSGWGRRGTSSWVARTPGKTLLSGPPMEPAAGWPDPELRAAASSRPASRTHHPRWDRHPEVGACRALLGSNPGPQKALRIYLEADEDRGGVPRPEGPVGPGAPDEPVPGGGPSWARAAFHAPSICPNSGLDSGRRPSSLRRERADLPYLAGLD
jgi:hypothetical protein